MIELFSLVHTRHQGRNFLFARYRETQMKTSQFSENFDLCHPQLGSEHSNNNLTTNSNFSSDIASKHDSIISFATSSATVNCLTSSTSSSSAAIATAYGSNSSDQQLSRYEKNANELLIKSQQRQQQQQEQNKKRKRETGDYFWVFSPCLLPLEPCKNMPQHVSL